MFQHTVNSLCLVVTSTLTFIFMAYVLSSFYKVFQTTRTQLDSELWLLKQCNDPNFFSNMYMHSDLCVKVDNNAKVGAFMLAVHEFSADFKVMKLVSAEMIDVVKLLAWPILVVLALLFLCAPTYLVQASRHRRWTECTDKHLKYA